MRARGPTGRSVTSRPPAPADVALLCWPHRPSKVAPPNEPPASFVKSLSRTAGGLHAPDVAVSLRRKREAPRGRYTPKLWPVWFVAPVALIAAGALGWVIYHYAYDHFAHAAANQKPPKPVNINDVLKATVTALTLIGAVLAGLYAYRKQLLAEGDAHRADASQLADRYTTAAEQLGHDQAAVRLAGVYALARLADDWAEQRQVCIDVLCAYLRMPYEPDPSLPGHKEGDREVRHTIIQVIRDHLQEPDAATAWCLHDFNFTGAVFDGGTFASSHFRGKATFSDAKFSSGAVSFHRAKFSGAVSFDSAEFSGSTVYFGDAEFSGPSVLFDDATFSAGTVYFDGVRFSGTVSFDDATFNGSLVSFGGGAEFSAGTVYFSDAEFSAGTIYFSDARFSGSTVHFSDVRFSGSTVNFGHATFSGGLVNFGDATLSAGAVSFGDAEFSAGTVYLGDVRFRGGTASFGGATFSGSTVNFGDAEFSGSTINFGDAEFSAGIVSFRGATLSAGAVSFGGGTTGFAPARFSGTTFEWGPLPVPAGA